MITVTLPYEAADTILVASITSAYEDLYKNYIAESDLYASNMEKYAHKKEDLLDMFRALHAMELLAGYFTVREQGKQKLYSIRDSLEAKAKLGSL
jgi:hypothetical protein